MVLIDFTKEELWNIIEVFDHDNFLDYDDDGELHRLREKIYEYYEQTDFVYVQGHLLSQEDSEKFIEYTEREPTQEELDYAKECDEVYRNTRVYKGGYCYKCKQEKESDYFRDVCESCFG